MATNITNSKNIVYQSSLQTDGDIHIGDVYNINGTLREIPLQLTTLPFIEKETVIGRKKDLNNIRQMMQETDRVLLVNGLGGIGKTTLAKYYLAHHQSEYNYIAWIDGETDIKAAFARNIALIDSLCLREEIEALSNDSQYVEHAFELIINRMRQLEGLKNGKKNLLLIDNATEDIEHTQTLDKISLRPHWKVLVTSREKLIGFKEYQLGFLSPKDAKELFYTHYLREKDDKLTKDILEQLGYHTLLIELTAKSSQSLRHSLVHVADLLKKKGLNTTEETKIKFPHSYNKKVVNIFEYLVKIFTFSELSEHEKWVMKQFSVLPKISIPYESNPPNNLLSLLQIKKDETKDKITTTINKLVDKGWLFWDKKADAFLMHSLIQEVTRSELKPNAEDCRDLIQEMFARTSYQKINFALNNNLYNEHLTRYINGSSVDFAELLDEYASVNLRMTAYSKSIELQQRALKMKLEVLPKNALQLADSYNALALSYLEINEYELALENQLKDLEITKIHTKEPDYNLGITYNNLSLIYRKTENYDKALSYQEKAAEIAENINDEDLNNVVYNNIGNLHYIQKNALEALKYFEKSLQTRIKNNADALWISEAHYNLSTALLDLSEFEKTKLHLDKAYEIEKKLIDESPSLAKINQAYGMLYFELREYKEALSYFLISLNIYKVQLAPDSSQVKVVEGWIKKVRDIS